jgi:hypothetical protein
VVYPGDQRLFVDPANNNFYLAPGTPAIDSSIDSLQDRPSLRNVKASVNIPPSNVLAPERDALGQLRRDDPSFQPSFGAGAGRVQGPRRHRSRRLRRARRPI